MLQLIVILLVITFGIFLIPGDVKRQTAIILTLVQAAAFVYFILQVPEVPDTTIKQPFYEWIPELGLNFEFILDGLSMVFALLVTGIGAIVFLYAHAYMKSYSGTTRFFFFL